MLCEKCKTEMVAVCATGVQGWSCPIRIISKIAGVNYIVARHMLEKDSVCILKAKAMEIKKALIDLYCNISIYILHRWK